MNEPNVTLPIVGTSLTLEGREGAMLRVNPSMRNVDLFGVQSTELEMLTSNNDKSKMFASAATFFLGLMCSIIVSALFSGLPTETSRVILILGAPLLLLVACIFGYFAYNEMKTGKSLVEHIKSQSKRLTD